MLYCIVFFGPKDLETRSNKTTIDNQFMEVQSWNRFRHWTAQVTVKHVGMLAGGTGITPMLQVVQAALRDSGDSCNFYMCLDLKHVFLGDG